MAQDWYKLFPVSKKRPEGDEDIPLTDKHFSRWEETLENLAHGRHDERKFNTKHNEYSDDKDRDEHLKSTKLSYRAVGFVEKEDKEGIRD
jgi:hypothetical protein